MAGPHGGSRRGATGMLLGIVLAALGVLWPAPAGAVASPAPAAGWTVVSSPNPSSKASLDAVSCFTATGCWAVGVESGSGGTEVPFTEETAGAGWSIISSPQVGGALQGVSCATATSCQAVGVQGSTTIWGAPLAERFANGGWSLLSTPATSSGNGDLTGVACVTASDCWAVGTQVTSSNGAVRAPLVEHYNGGSWSISAVASVDGGLSGVTCVTASDCWAVGYQEIAGNQTGLVEQYSSGAWTEVSSPVVSAYLDSAACLSASGCWAGGEDVMEAWNGTSWQVAAHPASLLSGMACIAAVSQCWAVGGTSDVLVEQYAGGAWAVVGGVVTPQPTGFSFAEFLGVACGASSECVAVGSTDESVSGSSSGQTLVEDYTVAPVSPTPSVTPSATPSAAPTGQTSPSLSATPTGAATTSPSATPGPAPAGSASAGGFPWLVVLLVLVVVVLGAGAAWLALVRRPLPRR
jgi:hypothetical protein